METKAQAKYIRIASRKVQVIIPAIKGKKVEEAIALLEIYSPERRADTEPGAALRGSQCRTEQSGY